MIKGIDVSHWNGLGNWEVTKEKDIEFAFIRLGSIEHTSGNCYTDYLLEEHTASSVEAKIPAGYYFYSRPYHDPVKQANFMVSVLRNLPLKLDFYIDVEVPAYAVGGKPANEVAKESITKMVDILKAANYYPGIYTRQSVWDDNVAESALWEKLKLWAARYNPELVSPWGDGKYMFRDWNTWKFWQYSSKNGLANYYGFPGATNGSFDGMDLNYYNGSKEQLYKEYELELPDRFGEIFERLGLIDNRLSIVEERTVDIATKLDLLTKWASNLQYK
jgi:GH25 family lysozyme M1 (1,4-beta-N-acetylmuramidase)